MFLFGILRPRQILYSIIQNLFCFEKLLIGFRNICEFHATPWCMIKVTKIIKRDSVISMESFMGLVTKKKA